MSEVAWEGSDRTYSDLEERRVLFAALDSFYQYAKVAHFNTTHLRRQSFYALPRAHSALLAAPPFQFLDTLIAVDDGIDRNAELAEAILESGLSSFGVPPDQDASTEHGWKGKATSADMEKARSTLRQFYRDWSEEGAEERKMCYGPVIKALQDEQKLRSDRTMRVLVPGAGLGRLVFELCKLGFHTEGNEISFHQLLASSYILNFCPKERSHTLYPWVHSFSNQRSRSNQLQSVLIPDIHPSATLGKVENPGDMSMSASDFICLYGSEVHRNTFDAVASMFFLDTAPNVIRYLETIRNCLRAGGLLVNLGPLLWHFENNAPGTHGHDEGQSSKGGNQGIGDPGSMELTDDEVIALVGEMGFDIEKRESGIAAPYIQDPRSMMQSIYSASHWIARKR